MRKINLSEAKARFSEIVASLQDGSETAILLCKRGVPVAVLTSAQTKKRRPLGVGRDLFGAHDFVLKDENDRMADLFGY